MLWILKRILKGILKGPYNVSKWIRTDPKRSKMYHKTDLKTDSSPNLIEQLKLYIFLHIYVRIKDIKFLKKKLL